jgi:hypothetical protein
MYAGHTQWQQSQRLQLQEVQGQFASRQFPQLHLVHSQWVQVQVFITV